MMFNKATICRSFMKSFIIHKKMSSILLHISVPLVIHLKATTHILSGSSAILPKYDMYSALQSVQVEKIAAKACTTSTVHRV